MIFSWTLAFKSSYLAKPSVNIGVTLYIIKKSTNPRKISAPKNIRLNVGIEEGFNDDEVLDFLQLTFQHKYDIVFMPTISYSFLKSKMPALRKIEGDFGEVEMYKYPGAVGRIGFLKN